MGKPRAEFIVTVREDLDDYKKSNRLLNNEEEFDDKVIARALEKALDRFNNTPPVIGSYSFENFPSDYLLIDMAIFELLSRASYKRGRNSLSYSEAGLHVNDQNFSEYLRLKNELRTATARDMKELKMGINLKRGFGYVTSAYRNLSKYD